MEMVSIKTKTQQWAMAKDIGRILGYKQPSLLLKRFREFADKNPNYFAPHKPYLKIQGMDTVYDILCFAFYFENRDLLDAGTRSLNFKKDLPRLREVYKENEY